ncbi:formimidoylglutamate deiminase [Phaeobacter sp.]|uniref:formimidoylglutamate deiminase n=1 Tax=Phaeobacter sp. TaxID=1902409 RepID=UPI0026014B5A|nr:formimidoylglutamate deiminase [Phaeobacter sp.]
MILFADSALLGDHWHHNVRITLSGGRISEICPDSDVQPGDHRVPVLLPALANLHSHSFQRAMAGMSEVKTRGRESFWTWRDIMYRFLDRLAPEQIEAIAALTFVEMLEAGFASVGEFHYVHHQPGGLPYDDPSELSQRILAAASEVGIGLTHLPVLYTCAGVNQEPLAGGQLRFGNELDRYLELQARCRSSLPDAPADTAVGIAPHSLRAIRPSDLTELLAAVPTGPVHIHIAEQLQEVADVTANHGQSPVAWLLDQVEVDDRWCLIHATHMTSAETLAMAQSGAVAGLCPVTEANLGDGAFNGPEFITAVGQFGVGSDSNIRISLTEELSTLEYSQRLRDMARGVMVVGEGSVGTTLFCGSARGGAQALGRDTGEIAVGKWADLMAVDRDHPALCGLRDEQVLDGLCFAAPNSVVTDVWSAGRHMVQQGRHVARTAVVDRYRGVMRNLMAVL